MNFDVGWGNGRDLKSVFRDFDHVFLPIWWKHGYGIAASYDLKIIRYDFMTSLRHNLNFDRFSVTMAAFLYRFA